MYGQFHWSITPWAIYALPSFAVAYCVHVRKQNFLRLSAASKGVLGKAADGWIGKLIDVIVVFALIGGVGTSLGLAVPLVTTLFGHVFGMGDSFFLKIVILVIWTAIFSASVYRGLNKGIKILSDINVALALVLLVYVLLVGPTVWILSLWCNSFGLFLDNFFRISLWMDPIAHRGFPESWTVFYWAWWIAFAPMVGLFVARISKGRTIRELVIAQLGWSSLGCILFLAIWGGYSVHIESTNLIEIKSILTDGGTPPTVLAILNTLPLSGLVVPVFTILCFIFLATTLDSSAYTLASITSKDLSGDEEPAKWNRIFWALLLAFFSVGLLAVGGLKIVQLSSIVVALPLMPVLVLICFSLMKWIKEDYGEIMKDKIYSVDYTEEGTKSPVVEQTSD
jgi:BCCT family betaine/carnitine transporter